MQYRIRRISPHSAGKISAVVSGCFSLLFWPFVLIAQFASKAAGAQNQLPAFFNMFFLILPLLYAVFGYVMTALMCVVYNFVSRYIGPLVLEMDTEPADPVQP